MMDTVLEEVRWSRKYFQQLNIPTLITTDFLTRSNMTLMAIQYSIILYRLRNLVLNDKCDIIKTAGLEV